MNVSLNSGFGWPRFVEVFDRAISCPILLTKQSFTYVSGAFPSDKFLNWLPFTISTVSRPVVPLYPRPIKSSGTPPCCCMEVVDPVLSDLARLSKSLDDPLIYGNIFNEISDLFRLQCDSIDAPLNCFAAPVATINSFPIPSLLWQSW